MNKEKNTEINDENEENYIAVGMSLGMEYWYCNRFCNWFCNK